MPFGDQNLLRHPLVEGNDGVSGRAIRPRIVKNADYRRVAPLQHAHNTAHAAAIGLGRLDFYEHLVALHRAVDLVGRDEDVVVANRLFGVRAHKAVAVAMQIEPPGGQIVARAARAQRAAECSSARGPA